MKTRALVANLAGLGAVAVVLAGCGGASGASSSTSAANAAMTQQQAKDYFLSVVCPVTTSLKVLENLPLSAGSWPAVNAPAAKPYVQSAIDAARRTATQLQAGTVVWPANLNASVQGVHNDMLGLLAPLGNMSTATNGAGMAAPWQIIASQPRINEQQARLDLGLPAANAANDGCPAVPKATTAPTAKPVAPAGGVTHTAAPVVVGGGDDNWQSESGNLKCAYFPHGSQGPSVACVDLSSGTLMRLNTGYSRRSQATESQLAQLPGGQIQGPNDPARDEGTLPDGRPQFTCWQGAMGMTCNDNATNAYFIIRAGYAYP